MPRRTMTTTCVVGAGRLARSLIPLLGPAGFKVTAIVARRLASARSAGRSVRKVRATTSLRIGVDRARLVLLAIPDGAIEGAASRLASLPAIDWSERIVLHHAGSLGPKALAPLSRVGANVGVLHPLQCLGGPRQAAAVLPGSRARIEGDPAARRVATALARALGLRPLAFRKTLTSRDRTAYHAAASLLSNDLLALLSIGVDLLTRSGLGRKAASDALIALARGTLTQIDAEGPAGALTGPVARGDVDTLEAHLRQLGPGPGEGRKIHRLLSIRLARLAVRHGEKRAAESLRWLLSGPDS